LEARQEDGEAGLEARLTGDQFYMRLAWLGSEVDGEAGLEARQEV
jgi:hypothetical protein